MNTYCLTLDKNGHFDVLELDEGNKDHGLWLDRAAAEAAAERLNNSQPMFLAEQLGNEEGDRARRIVGQISGEVYAQLEELSDETRGLLVTEPDKVMAEDLRGSLLAAVDQRFSDWLADNDMEQMR